MLRVFSTFSGVGGFEQGLENAFGKENIQVVGYSEFDTHQDAIYKSNFPTHKAYGDITKIDFKELPDFDLLVGGVPCQSWSIAGNREGFEDARGTMWYEYFRCLKDKQPKYFIAENVKGLISHDGGKSVEWICESMCELGYVIDLEILNSKYFGVPQNRERIFIVGIRKDVYESKSQELNGQTQSVTSGESQGYNGYNPFPKTFEEYTTIKDYLRGICGPKILSIPGTDGQHQGVENPSEPVIPCLTARGEGEYHAGMQLIGQEVKAVMTPNRAENRANGRRIKDEGDPSFTLTAMDVHGITDGYAIRRLTPTECERLQSFPDGWTKYGTFEGVPKEMKDSRRYKAMGNAVTTSVIKYLVLALYQQGYLQEVV